MTHPLFTDPPAAPPHDLFVTAPSGWIATMTVSLDDIEWCWHCYRDLLAPTARPDASGETLLPTGAS